MDFGLKVFYIFTALGTVLKIQRLKLTEDVVFEGSEDALRARVCCGLILAFEDFLSTDCAWASPSPMWTPDLGLLEPRGRGEGTERSPGVIVPP